MSGSQDVPTGVDHLVYAVPDFDAGVSAIHRLLGIKPVPGGRHPDYGTRNALVALGPETYLEIIGPDPEQPRPLQGRVFGPDAVPNAFAVIGVAMNVVDGPEMRLVATIRTAGDIIELC